MNMDHQIQTLVLVPTIQMTSLSENNLLIIGLVEQLKD